MTTSNQHEHELEDIGNSVLKQKSVTVTNHDSNYIDSGQTAKGHSSLYFEDSSINMKRDVFMTAINNDNGRTTYDSLHKKNTISMNVTSLQTENLILKRKMEILQDLNKENKTKYKEFELQITHKYKQKEEEYMARIEQLEQYANINKLQLKKLASDSSNKEQIVNENNEYQQEIKSLKHKLMRKQSKIQMLEQEINELKMMNDKQTNDIYLRSEEIFSLQQMLSSSMLIKSENMNFVDIDRNQSSTFKLPDTTLTTNNSTGSMLFLKQPTTTKSSKTQDINDNNVTFVMSKINEPQIETEESWLLDEGIESKQNNDIEEFRTLEGKLVIKQCPHSIDTHIWINIFIEMNKEMIVMYLNKNCSVRKLLKLLTTSKQMKKGFNNKNVMVYVGNHDGGLDDNNALQSRLDDHVILSQLGIMNVYIKSYAELNKNITLDTCHCVQFNENNDCVVL